MINNDQIPSKYVQVGRFTMAPQGAKKIGMSGIVDIRMITLMLTFTIDGKIYHLKQFIKEKQSSLSQKLIFQQVLV